MKTQKGKAQDCYVRIRTEAEGVSTRIMESGSLLRTSEVKRIVFRKLSESKRRLKKSGDHPMDPAYESGMHDGILEVIKALGFEMNEPFCD